MSTTTAVSGDTRTRLFDADNHYYEAYDAFTRFMEPKLRDKAIRVVDDPDHEDRRIIVAGDGPLKAIAAHPQDYANAPGSLHDMFVNHRANDEEMHKARVDVSQHPQFWDRDARIQFMDDEGIDGCVLYPSLGVMVEQDLAHDIPATYANLHAFNRWVEEDWGYNYQGRIFAAPMLSLLDLSLALEELDRVLALGARAVHIRPGSIYGRSPADPYFDPFWARLEEAGVPLAMHSSFPNYYELVASLWGEDPAPTYADITPFQQYIAQGERPMADTLAAMVLHGLFTRFPKLHVMSIESGSDWLAHLLSRVDHCALLGRRSRVAPKLHDQPSSILARHLYISPHPEDDLSKLTEVMPPERIMFGSDYPHAEGLAHPAAYEEKAAVLGPDACARVMGVNAAELLGAW